jgi:hypothetical protein
MDARSSEPGLDIPQTRQRLEPALTSAPQPLQAKTNIAAPSVWFSQQEHFVVADYSASKAGEEGTNFREAFIVPHRPSRARVPARKSEFC